MKRYAALFIILTLLCCPFPIGAEPAEAYADGLDYRMNGHMLEVAGNIKNAPETTIVISAVYTEDGTLLSAVSGADAFLLRHNIQTLSGCTARLFVLDGADTLRPLCPAYETDEKAIRTWNSIDERKALAVDYLYRNPFPSPYESADPSKPNTVVNVGRTGYAMTLFYKGIALDTANEMLRTACENSNPAVNDFAESETYFQMPILLRIYFQFQPLLTDDAKEAVEDYFYQYVNHNSKMSEAADEFVYKDGKYYIEASGNHHVIRRTAYYLGSRILKDSTRYQNAVLADGNRVQAHFAAWEHYWEQDLKTRGTRAYEVEYFSNGYDKYTLGCMLTLRDCSESRTVSRLAEKYMDLVMADLVVQSLDGMYGGARSRSVRTNELDKSADTYLNAVFFNCQSSWRVPGATDPVSGNPLEQNRRTNAPISYHPNQVALFLSDYRPPYVLMDLALSEKGSYEYESFPVGRGTRIGKDILSFYMDFPSYIRRYSYITPDYVVGSMSYSRDYAYSDIQQQNRYIGIHYRNRKEDPVYTRAFVETERSYTRGYNDINSVASGSALLAYSLLEAKYHDASIHRDIKIGISDTFYENAVMRDGWMMAYDPDGEGYLAVKPSKGQIEGWDTESEKYIKYLLFDTRRIPIVMQAGSKTEYGSFEAFCDAVAGAEFRWENEEFIYTSPGNGGTITWRPDTQLPLINGSPVTLDSPYFFRSPYLNSEMGSGIVTVQNTTGGKYRIDFNMAD